MSVRVGNQFAGLAALLGASPALLADTETARLLQLQLDSFEFLFASRWLERTGAIVFAPGNTPGWWPIPTFQVPQGKNWLLRSAFGRIILPLVAGDTFTYRFAIKSATSGIVCPYYGSPTSRLGSSAGTAGEIANSITGPVVMRAGDILGLYFDIHVVITGSTFESVAQFAEFDAAL